MIFFCDSLLPANVQPLVFQTSLLCYIHPRHVSLVKTFSRSEHAEIQAMYIFSFLKWLGQSPVCPGVYGVKSTICFLTNT